MYKVLLSQQAITKRRIDGATRHNISEIKAQMCQHVIRRLAIGKHIVFCGYLSIVAPILVYYKFA